MSDAKPTEEPPGRTTVLVLNYNGQQHLEACLESLGRMDVFVPGSPGVARDRSQRDEVWLVDNASSDNSIALVRARFPWVRVVENESNLGFSRAYNRAAAVCQTRWVVFLNNDTCVGSDWLSALHAAAARHPGAAATASRIMGWDGERIDFVGADTYFTGHALQHDVGAPAGGRTFAERPILFGCAGALMFRRDLFLELGGFDPAYFSFFEDVDLGWRAALSGYQTWFAPEAVVRHRLHASWGGGISSRGRYLLERNALFTVFKNYADVRMGVILLTSAALTFLRAWEASPSLKLLASPRVPADALAHLLALAELLTFRGELGERRRGAQVGRRRDDGELLDLFGAVDSPPFSLGETFRPAYQRICSPARQGRPARIGTWTPEVNVRAEEAVFAIAHVCANAVAQRYPVQSFVASDPPLGAELPLSPAGARMLSETRDALERFLNAETTVETIDELCLVLERVKRIEPHESQGVPINLLPSRLEHPERLAPLLEREPLERAPRISLVVRTRNRLHLLRRALDSVSAQRYPDLEVVVVNDGGEDPTPVLADFSAAFTLRLVPHATSLGRARSAQVGLENASGTYVSFLDDDDVLHPHHLRTLAEELMRTSARVAYSNVECLLVGYGEHGAERVVARSVFASEFDPTRLLFENTIPIMAVLMEREIALEVGGFDPALDYFEDWDLWIRLSRRTSFRHIPVVTATYYVPQASKLHVTVEDDPRWPYLGRLFDKHRDHIGGKEWASFYIRYVEAAKARLSESEVREARRELLLSDTAARLRSLQEPRVKMVARQLRRWVRWR